MISSDRPKIEPPTDTSPRRRARSFLPRFGLRSLLIVSLLGCPLFAWVGSNLHRSRQEDAAIEMLRRAGAGIYLHGDDSFAFVDEERMNEEVDRGKATSFLDLAIGRSHRPRVREVVIDHRTAPDSTIRAAVDAMRHLPEIEQVTLWGPFFDDATCDGLSRMSQLKELSLRSTSVSERGLSSLESLPQLQTITIGDLPTGDAVAALPRLKRLRTITLVNMYVSREDIAGIAALPELQTLELTLVASKDEGTFQPLSGAKTLRMLTIELVRFDGEELSALAGLRNLKRLRIPVQDDESLTHFAGLSKLRRLDLFGEATPDAVRRFSAEMPELVVRLQEWDSDSTVCFRNGEAVDHELFNARLPDEK